MGLNKARGNMYGFLNDYPHKGADRGYTINFIKGWCPFQCVYCYYQSNPRYKKKIGELRIDEKEFQTNLGKDNFIFVGSSTDMFADEVPSNWILKVLSYCSKFDNKYLFQTKNPERFQSFIGMFPDNSILGVTLESDRYYKNISNAPIYKAPPSCKKRASAMRKLEVYNLDRMVSIEPVLNFNLMTFVEMIKGIKPLFVSVGADSQGHNLPEPSLKKLNELIDELNNFTEVRIKSNLGRLREYENKKDIKQKRN